MKKIILSALFSVCIAAGALAQSMSDSQIIQFIQKEQKAGTSQSQIVTKLMQKGVSVQKLQQIRKKYQNLQKSGSGSSAMGKSNDGESSDRLRTANGTSMRGGRNVRHCSDVASALCPAPVSHHPVNPLGYQGLSGGDYSSRGYTQNYLL